uniref:Uncharacterized protein n=1 Tax=Arundo donax TaxID=35708 RepID=A0A0A9E1D3_ARUDO
MRSTRLTHRHNCVRKCFVTTNITKLSTFTSKLLSSNLGQQLHNHKFSCE